MSELVDFLVDNEPSFRRARLPALYSDFSAQRTLNPDGYTANVSAWKRALSRAVMAGRAPSKSATRDHFTLDLDDAALPAALESKQFGRPLALGAVMADAVAAGEMLPLQHFMTARESVYHKGSWASVPWNVLAWGFRQTGLASLGSALSGGADRMPRGRFVVLQNLEEAARAFSDAVDANRTTPFERTFTRAHFRRTFESSLLAGTTAAADNNNNNNQRLSETDMDVLVQFLSRDKGLVVADGSTIRIVGAGDQERRQVTEEDAATASLRELSEDLTREVAAMERRAGELTQQAREAAKKRSGGDAAAARSSALAALRSRRAVEAGLERRHAALAQLDEVAGRLQQAADNAALVRVMRSSAGALRELNAQAGDADSVAEALGDLRDQMGRVDEVGELVAAAGREAVDEAEVDGEFEALLAEEEGKRDEARDRDTARRLAELAALGVPAGDAVGGGEEAIGTEKQEGGARASSPATTAAEQFGALSLGAS